MENITVYSHSACLSKENGEGHPERKERLESILDSIQRIDDISIDLKEASFKSIEISSILCIESSIDSSRSFLSG